MLKRVAAMASWRVAPTKTQKKKKTQKNALPNFIRQVLRPHHARPLVVVLDAADERARLGRVDRRAARFHFVRLVF